MDKIDRKRNPKQEGHRLNHSYGPTSSSMCRTKRLIPADIIVGKNTFNFQGNQGKVLLLARRGAGGD